VHKGTSETKAVIQLYRYDIYRSTNKFLILTAKIYKPLHYKMTNLWDLFVENGDSFAILGIERVEQGLSMYHREIKTTP
jgi:hypothetical protein